MKGSNRMSWLNRFLMSLAATTVSIVLTFGTTVILDRKKQKEEKREMVMMVMYDMRESLRSIEECTETFKTFFDTQVDIIAHPDKFRDGSIDLLVQIPVLDYTTTTESIFRSNIETINTIGNILFVETVSEFYDKRERYKSEIAIPFYEQARDSIKDYESLTAFDSSYFAYFASMYMLSMKLDFEQCMQMMKVSDKDLDIFSKEWRKLLESSDNPSLAAETERLINERNQRVLQMQQARKEGRESLE